MVWLLAVNKWITDFLEKQLNLRTYWWSLNYGVSVYIHKSLVTKVERFNDKTESFFVDFDSI